MDLIYSCCMEHRNPSLEDVKRRRVANAAERKRHEDSIGILLAEDQELAIAEKVLERLQAGGAWITPPPVPPPPPFAPPPPLKGIVEAVAPPYPWENLAGMTVEEAITQVLKSNVDPWMTANEIQEIAKLLGKDIPMASISPTLSNMKGKTIVRDGLKVALISRVPAFEEAEDRSQPSQSVPPFRRL